MPLPEKQLISRIRGLTRSLGFSRGRRASLIAGIGDDCSVLRIPTAHDVLVTTDFSLEGVHFRREWHPAESVGHRCLTRGLSDIAAMGGKPIAAFLSLALPANLKQRWVDEFMRGLLSLARQFKVELAGGDTSQSGDGVLADILVVGSVPKGKAILRSGAQPGDRIYVTGQLGGSAAALGLLYSDSRKKLKLKLYSKHFYPTPRIDIGMTLREKGITSSMIDTSDGLSTDLSHICEESSVGAEILEGAIPRAKIGRSAREVELQFALHGGEDYELLFTSSRRVPAKIDGIKVTEIGRITRSRKIVLVNDSGATRELRPAGWEHFRQHSADK